MLEEIKQLSDSERLIKLTNIGYSDSREYPDRQALNDQEIAELKSRIDFQSHTVTHPVLPRLY